MKNLVLFGMLCSLCCLLSGDRQVRADNPQPQKVFSGVFTVAGASTGWPTTTGNFSDNVAKSPMLDLKIHIAPKNLYGLNFDVECKHFTNNDDFGFWVRQRKLVLDASYPIPNSQGLTVFTEYERHYSGGFGSTTDWALAGLRYNF